MSDDQHRFRPRLPDDHFIDQIVVETVPRYKTSGLSGDEWRTSVSVTAYRKGRVVKERHVGNIKYAQQMMATNDWWQDDEAIPDPNIADDLCDQPGCDQPWTVLYRRVQEGCGRCGSVKPSPSDRWFQAFCARHAIRGDCGLHDADRCYELVEGTPRPDPMDESPSAFGGVIEMGSLDER